MPRDRFDFAAEPLPSDGEPRPADTTAPTTVVARFASVAEAGYFAEALAEDEIEATLHAEERFDAISGAWTFRYALLVHEVDAAEAADRLRELIDDDSPRERATRFHDAPPNDRLPHEPAAGPSFLPWALVGLVVVAAAVAMARPGNARPAGRIAGAREAAARDPWRAITRQPGRWVQADERGRAIRQIVVREDGSATLLEDTDGDGRPDARTEYESPIPQ